MAKAKTTPSPKRGTATGKAKASATPDPPLRRSPRKAVQSAKKAEAEQAAKVTKKASPAKKTSTVKKVANALKKSTATKKATKAAAPSEPPAEEPETTSAKKATSAAKAKSPAPKKTAKDKSPSPKKAASPAPAKSATASPRPRGRPKKRASPAATKAVTASPKPRGRPRKDASPGKVTKKKAPPKKKDPSAPTHSRGRSQPGVNLDGPSSDSEDDSSLEDLDGGGGNVDDASSVEITGSRARSKSPAKAAPPSRKPSATRAQSRSRSPAKAAPPRRTSGAGVRGRPQSPVKIPNSMSGFNARSRSPTKVVKPASPRKPSAAGARVRSKSPVKGGRKASPARNLSPPSPLRHIVTGPWIESIFNQNDENRFNLTSNSAPDSFRLEVLTSIETDRKTGEKWFVKTTRRTWRKGHPDAPDVKELDAELFRRGAGAPDKVESKTSSHYDSRVGVEVCTRTEKRGWRRQLAEWPGETSSARKASQSPTRKSPKSPTKKPASSPTSPIHKKAAPRSPTKPAPRRRSSEIRWDDKFAANDSQGKALRKLEMKAYAATKGGKVFAGDSAYANDVDCARARRQGVERAKAEAALRELGSARQQRVREGYEGRGVDLEDGGGRRGSRAASQSPTRPPKPNKPSASRRKSESTPPPPNSRRNSSVSKPGRKTSATSEASNPLSPGRPSAPDRGTAHSVTNPELIAGTKKKNPFFETMPGPEFWHREQPPYFMFGETPWMARQISRQIEADLAKGTGGNAAGKAPDKQQRSGSLAGLSKLLSPLLGRSQSAEPSSSQAQRAQASHRSPFALPVVKDEDLAAAMRELVPDAGKKRRASGGASPARDPRRPRRMSGGNGSGSRSPPAYRMSGAL